MLTVEQVRRLDNKVKMAVELIDSLKAENSTLKTKLDEYKQRVEQLESVVNGFKKDQIEIEEGIRDVLLQLDRLEDQITAPAPAPPHISHAPPDTDDSAFEEEPETEQPAEQPEFKDTDTPELEIF